MADPDERAHKLKEARDAQERENKLKEARDAQERENNAAHELIELKEKMKRFEEQIQKEHATIRDAHNQAETFTRELSYLDSEEQRLRQPLPIGNERAGGPSQRDVDIQLAAIANRRMELLRSRQTALDNRHTAQNAINEAQGEWYIASGQAILPEREREESQRQFENILNEIAPPPSPEVLSTEAEDNSNGGLSSDKNDEDNEEDPRNRR